MVEIERDARFARSPEFAKRRLLRIGIASTLAGGMLVGVSAADARITHIQVLTRATAFGGYSFPGVGQYEAITGIASGEVDPNDPQECADHRHPARAAERERQRRLPAQFLHPEAAST